MKKIWLIGASEGIGRALSIELAKDEENYLILSARNTERLKDLANGLHKKPLLIPLDVCDMESIMKGWETIEAEAKSIDTFIYCAGHYNPMSAESMDIDEIEKIINVNLIGAMRTLNIVIPQFIKQQRGNIILIGSIAGYRGLPNSMGYGESKAAIIHLAENLKCDLSKYNIKVQVINPGFVKTRLTDLNKFYMPSIITAEQAATYIIKTMRTNAFEARFPFIFANFLKLITMLPYAIYFRIVKLIVTSEKE